VLAEGEISNISVGQFESLSHLLASNESLQIAFAIMIAGIIVITIVYRKFASWTRSKKFHYDKPLVAQFVRTAILPLFAIALVTSTNAYIQSSELFADEIMSLGPDENLSPKETFAKLLNTFNILVIGYTIAYLIPIALAKKDRSKLEEEDFDSWFESRGFIDDKENFFHKCYRWIPPKTCPEDLEEAEFQKHLKTKEGLKFLEEFHTSKGNPLGSYEKLVANPFKEWKKSERKKFQKYYKKCITGDNQSGRKLNPGAKPEEIYSIDAWREEKRLNNYEPIIPSSRPPGYFEKKREDAPKSIQQIIPLAIFAAVILGIVAWWGVDLWVLATATGGLSIGIGLALQETLQNYFAYIVIRKDKIFKVGDRVQLETGYNGYVHKISPRVTYIRNALHESLAIIPTRQLVTAQIINFSKEIQIVPAKIEVGVSYLNNPRQVASILVKVGKRTMREIKDSKGRHLVKQNRCPYLDENKPSCGCDKDILVDIKQPTVRFNNFNDSSLDFSLWVFVRDYGSQFITKTEMRMIMYEEFKKYDIRIPWPIRTIYQGDEKKEAEEIGKFESERNKVIDEYGTGDILKGDGEGGGE
jgi:potassium-dependent mechanosensitive channel